ncbi:divalent cation tolerance protein CutA [Methanococcus maripaludis]|mgnify:CR=1 FL=1|jgi:periplasmic divalent cation tolerance protein|uniref:CutA1 divalent ion tolerance protein Related Protein n=5 Tax=Methanococcus maripaludis TaxID=39152 RepID=Q6LY30_METMP|nr:divalent-cation tolerance protein CutA [Methanococcus maripaludis]MDK2929132.1 periplasmic divalent cation tolerance protein [Methanococcus sp.]AEK20193.1 CutA1 divalent ion tolerance protein [Methanococcus maripaludis X1]MBA2847058.1 periplasmic divalent cation tolerance protein [Methanococcus maripaludis]MBA2857868.1 periplasmic divalent cation tolerance protein [Methanococcus maripaludis]MBB6066912.1 periplasmic divalent cation tolerance protein [Methanococcus maripaludis]
MEKPTLVYTTFPNFETAKSIVGYLLEKKMIACANLREHEAHYFNDGDLSINTEIGAFLKTTENRWISLKDMINEIHPLETPAILKINIDDSNDEFKNWILNIIK